jgi:hypothetical protein
MQYNRRIHYLEEILSRIINPESAGKDRTHLTKAVVLAVRKLAQQTQPGAETRDLAAFIALALFTIAGTIDTSVAAWEKRGYWVKADKFRMEWAWTGILAEKMRYAVCGEDWDSVALTAAQVALKLNKITIPKGNRQGQPWVGAWDEMQRRY